MVNDPQWQRFRGDSSLMTQLDDPLGVVTIGVGGYRCEGCEKVHMTLALITDEAIETSVLLSPETAVDVAKAIVLKLGEHGHSQFAVAAMRCMTMVNELATMTDIEADFLDGGGLREAARATLGEGPIVVGQVLPRRYSEQDRSRAVAAIRGINAGRKSDTEMGQMVDLIAEALGLRLGGA